MFKEWFYANLSHPFPSDEVKFQFADRTGSCLRFVANMIQNGLLIRLAEIITDHLSSTLGLSFTQVATWFINARKRVWKPLIRHSADIEELQSSEYLTSSFSASSSDTCSISSFHDTASTTLSETQDYDAEMQEDQEIFSSSPSPDTNSSTDDASGVWQPMQMPTLVTTTTTTSITTTTYYREDSFYQYRVLPALDCIADSAEFKPGCSVDADTRNVSRGLDTFARSQASVMQACSPPPFMDTGMQDDRMYSHVE